MQSVRDSDILTPKLGDRLHIAAWSRRIEWCVCSRRVRYIFNPQFTVRVEEKILDIAFGVNEALAACHRRNKSAPIAGGECSSEDLIEGWASLDGAGRECTFSIVGRQPGRETLCGHFGYPAAESVYARINRTYRIVCHLKLLKSVT